MIMPKKARNIMLKLINIKKNENIIEADYIPEQSNSSAHVKLNISNDEYEVESIDDFGGMYSRMALNGLRRTLDELKNGKITAVPNERTVMWY